MYFINYNNTSEIKPIKIRISAATDSRWLEFSPALNIVDSIRGQRYFLLQQPFKTGDTLFLKLAGENRIHKIYDFKYLKMPHNKGGSQIVEECRLHEITLDGQVQTGGVVLFDFDDK
ncbi:hypothetical protein [Niabella hirudinis]|uniref:hypothetical protein n=1 Tax=Niabella hirudinis TaxID=1285929 RepID=UPI003EB8D36A